MILAARPAAADAHICEQNAHFAGDLAAPGYNPPPFTPFAYFAIDIGISGDGQRAILGEFAYGEPEDDDVSNFGPGQARIYSRSSGQWLETHPLQHDDPDDDDEFGASVAIDGPWAVITAPSRFHPSQNPLVEDPLGAVYFFEYDESIDEWLEHTEMFNPGDPGEDFGGSSAMPGQAAIQGRLAAVTAVGATVGNASRAGVVYLFAYSQSQDEWTLIQTLTAPWPVENGHFGSTVEISGDHIVVGAAGCFYPFGGPFTCFDMAGQAFIFKRTGTNQWDHEATLDAGSLSHSEDGFGWSVSIDGAQALIGAPFVVVGNDTSGRAFLFRYDAQTEQWHEEEVLAPSDDEDDQEFGWHVSISGSLALIGAPWYTAPDPDHLHGSAYLFQKQVGPVWNEVLQFFALLPGHSGNLVGYSLALRGDQAFIGANSANNHDVSMQNVGAVMILDDLPGCSGP